MPKPAIYGETLAREVDLRIDRPVANTAAITALGVTERADGMLVAELTNNTLWLYSIDSVATAGPTVLAPDAGAGRWFLVGGGPAAAGGLQILAEATITSADLTTAGVGPETENIGAVVSQNAIVLGYRLNLTDAFDNGAGVSLTVEVGHDNDADAYEDGFDAFTGSAFEGAGWVYVTPGPGIGAPAFDGTSTGQITAAFTAGADQLDNFTNGSLTIQVLGVVL